eukprot:5927834-Prymnesium_polylepis.1
MEPLRARSVPPLVPPAFIEAMGMTHAVTAWPPEPARGCCGGVRQPLCVIPVCPWQCLSCPSFRALPNRNASGTRP